jgi:hypothetical protein
MGYEFGAFRASDLAPISETFGDLPPNTSLFSLLTDAIIRGYVTDGDSDTIVGANNEVLSPNEKLGDFILKQTNSLAQITLNIQGIYSNSKDTALWVEVSRAQRNIQPLISYTHSFVSYYIINPTDEYSSDETTNSKGDKFHNYDEVINQ